MRTVYTSAAAVLAGGLLALAASADAATFSAYTQPLAIANNCSGTLGGANASGPISASVSCGYQGATYGASAYANYGAVGAMADGSGGGGGNATASFFDTVRFTSDDPSAGFTTVAINLDLGGFLSAEAGPYDINYLPPQALAGITANLYFNEGGPYVFSHTIISDRDGSRDQYFRNDFTVLSGDAGGASPNLQLRTPTFYVPLNRNISIGFLMYASASTFGATSGAYSNFFHTLTFATGRDVFSLPEGVTANAGDYLVNNRFGTAPTGVPEPDAWMLLVAGFGALGALIRRRRAFAAAA